MKKLCHRVLTEIVLTSRRNPITNSIRPLANAWVPVPIPIATPTREGFVITGILLQRLAVIIEYEIATKTQTAIGDTRSFINGSNAARKNTPVLPNVMRSLQPILSISNPKIGANMEISDVIPIIGPATASVELCTSCNSSEDSPLVPKNS